MIRNSFESLSSEFLENLGAVAYHSGVRPSSLLEWNDPDDWIERLEFDSAVIQQLVPKLYPKVK